jgi:hypothetical protein
MRQLTQLSPIAVLLLLASCGGGGGGSNGGSAAGANLPAGNAPITSAVSGIIVDQAGVPVAGATVSVFHHNTNTAVTTVTDANGRYFVAGLSTGSNAEYAIYAEKAGFGFYPSPSDAAAAIERFDFNGLYRTVVHIATMPTHDVTSANFSAYGASDSMASLPRTGQATSYAGGDDSAKQMGVAWPGTRFTDNLDGTITDHLSGLLWLKNAGCFTPTDWSAALTAASQLASGACGLTDGSTAGQWRMPNVNELESLVDVSQSNPALSAAHPFTNVDLSRAYWSSTTYMAGPANAMAIRFTDGRWINGIDAGDAQFSNTKATSANSLWAVRSGSAAGAIRVLATGVYHGIGGDQSNDAGTDARLQIGVPLTSPRFIDNGDGTLHDTVTGLTWLKQADCIAQTWPGALNAVNSLASGQCGLSDGSGAGQWRLPNRNEMLSLSDRAPTFPQASYFDGQAQANLTVTGPVIFRNFIVSDYYWTSTTDAADTTQAWAIYSCDFGVYNLGKSEVHYALAVR